MAIIANETKGDVAKKGSGSASVQRSKKELYVDLCWVDNIFATSYCISSLI